MDYKKGQWLAICDRCGFRYYSGDLSLEWTRAMCCSSCWEERHPLDFVKAVPDEFATDWQRPEPYADEISPFDYFVYGYMEIIDGNGHNAEYININGVALA
jgi:hypothetical protein